MVNKVKEAYELCSSEETSEYLANLLIDDENTSFQMFEELASEYLEATPEYQEGINTACRILTGHELPDIADNLLKNHKQIIGLDEPEL